MYQKKCAHYLIAEHHFRTIVVSATNSTTDADADWIAPPHVFKWKSEWLLFARSSHNNRWGEGRGGGLFMYIQGKQLTVLLLVNHCDCKVVLIFVCHFFYTKNCCSAGSRNDLQYDGSNDDLDWRIDFKYLNFVCIRKYLRSRVIKGCFFEWKCLHLSNFNLRLDLIKTSFFKVLTYLNRSGGKFYIV